jgi:uncharacterized NAD(P)/FAD-binding protein YdhS
VVRTIAVVGGGFSGTVLASRLLRLRPAQPIRIVLIERGARLGRGVAYAARGSNEPGALEVDRVVNCTGPDYAPQRSADPPVRGLLRDGLAVPDPLGLGLRTGPNGALVDADGRSGPRLYYLGSMLRADHWETTAAHELRGHADRLAAHLASSE